MALAGSELIGSMPMPEASENYVFARGRQVIILVPAGCPPRGVVLWRRRAANGYLGPQCQAGHRWQAANHRRQPDTNLHQRGELRDCALAAERWKMDKEQLPTAFGLRQRNAITLTNTFDVPVRGMAQDCGRRGFEQVA